MPTARPSTVLVINAGSSSIKFALYAGDEAAPPLWRGAISAIGTSRSQMAVEGPAEVACQRRFAIPEHVTAASVLGDWLRERLAGQPPQVIVHRIVHGGPECCALRVIDRALLHTLYGTANIQPAHLPHELHLIDMLQRQYPAAVPLACFDSSFHASMPLQAAMLPIPRHYYAAGVRRYGFHGLACAALMGQLAQEAGPGAAMARTVIAHLGGGASVTAVNGGLSCDTSMGLTPASGIMSGTRSGDLDPGLAWYLGRREQMTLSGFQHMVNHASGLLGISGTSGDLRTLLEAETTDHRAAEAVQLFCYQVRKEVWSMAGAMDGIETLIFAGGAGAQSAPLRERVCAGLSALGVVLEPDANAAHAALISAPGSAVQVRVMQADEEAMLAQQAQAWLATAAAPQAGSHV